jgi:hypothetical protein
MSYRRTGTYVAFYADGKREPTESDIKYYRLLQAWKVRDDGDFTFVDSHEKTAALRDGSMHTTVMCRLKERMLRSRNMILIIGRTTRFDTDWVPFEIQYAGDECSLPIIAAYPGFTFITRPAILSRLWPAALARRIADGSAHVIHIPFRKQPLRDAVDQFSCQHYPSGRGLSHYGRETYAAWGMVS